MNRLMKIGSLAFLFFVFIFTNPCFAGNYFQQDVSYTIHVTLDDRLHTLSGTVEIKYTNNSSVILQSLYFHLWPNAYKDENTVLAKLLYQSGDPIFLNANPEDFGFIDSLNFQVNGLKTDWKLLPDTAEVCILKLSKGLLPGEQITITTPFQVKIPSAELSRLGHHEQAYFISQWFPKPAVFDSEGWKYMPYMDKGEFYSEFGTFDVFITLPKNYIVGATGELQNGEKEIAWLDELDKKTRGITTFPDDFKFPTSDKETKTLHYRQERVHDFAWFADKRWHVLKDLATLPSGKKVTTWSYFTNAEPELWKRAPEYSRDAILYFSKWVGEYPYSSVTALDVNYIAGSGMEYPMITTIGNYGDSIELEETIVHEIGHNWFYGILGNDERRHAWMDEGMTDFLETRYIYTKYKTDSIAQEENIGRFSYWLLPKLHRTNHRLKQYSNYALLARANYDMVPDQSAEKYNPKNYRICSYSKPAMSFDHLKAFLGETLFDSCMHEYFDQWKFKHPTPAAQQKVFERVSGKNLLWFYQGLLKTNIKNDYSISSIHTLASNQYRLTIKKCGVLNLPFSIDGTTSGKSKSTIWLQPIQDTTVTITCDGCDAFQLDANQTLPELYRNNNTIRTSGIFKKCEPIRLKLGTSNDEKGQAPVYFAPVAGFNATNKFMAGIVLHNVSFFKKSFEYTLMPMYAFGTEDLNGGGELRYHFFPKGKIYLITLSSGFSSYKTSNENYPTELRFAKVDDRITFSFLPKDQSKMISNDFIVRHVYIYKKLPVQIRGNRVSLHFVELNYIRKNENPLERGNIKINTQLNKEQFRLNFETNKFITYGKAKKGFEIRFFAGYTDIKSSVSPTVDYRMRLSGRSGPQDYLFDEVFLGRAELSNDFYSRQFVVADAGFKAPTLFYRIADKWMTGLNLSTTLPGFIPFKLFFDIGTYDKAKSSYIDTKISWEAGIELPIIKDVLTVYFPLFYSKDIQYVIDQQQFSKSDLIRFDLRLNNLNPLTTLRNRYKY